MSLHFCAQHKAWQERIYKELQISSKFHIQNSVNSYSKLPDPRKLRVNRKTKKLEASQVFSHKLNNVNVYAEPRGKYSRPAPLLNERKFTHQMLTPKSSNLLQRPSTAGNLKRSGSAMNTFDRLKTKANSTPQSRGSISVSRSLQKLPSYKTIKDEKSIDIEAKAKSEPVPDSALYKINNKNTELPSKNLPNAEGNNVVDSSSLKAEQDVEQKKINDDKEENPASEMSEEENDDEKHTNKEEMADGSNVSVVTTSTHRRYILELEEMLRDEKMRRIKAETELARRK